MVRLDDPELTHQAETIEQLCARRDWDLLELVPEVEPAARRSSCRPSLTHAIERLRRGDADYLVVAELKRLCRSIAELGGILEELERADARLVSLDLHDPGKAPARDRSAGPAGGDASVIGSDFDFTEPAVIGSTHLDTAFTALNADGGVTTVRMESPEGSRRVELWMAEDFRYVHGVHGRYPRADRATPARHRDRADDLPAERVAQRHRPDPAGPRIVVDVTLGDPRMTKTNEEQKTTEVVIVGAGFAGIGCVKELAKRKDVHVTLLDKHNYHQFLPLLYQVATYQLAPADVAMDLRQEFRSHPSVSIELGDVASIDPAAHSVTTHRRGSYSGDFIVLAAGSQANFFDTPGAEHVFPMYSLDDAERLRSRLLAIFEDADRDPSLIGKGALNIVIVGAGATGTEVAGAIADLVRDVLPSEFHDLAVNEARVIVVDLGDAVLGPFSPKAHGYASKVLVDLGVELRLGTSVKEIGRITWCSRTARRSSPTASSGAVA